MRVAIDVQEADFELSKEMLWMRQDGHETGAITSFVGLVRDFSEAPEVQGMHLEHYPGMTELSLQKIAEEAGERWRLLAVRIIHRVGRLGVGEQIVLVMVASAHRADSFAACEFVMDFLKVKAPFWKKELTGSGAHWVEARRTDQDRAESWQDTAE